MNVEGRERERSKTRWMDFVKKDMREREMTVNRGE